MPYRVRLLSYFRQRNRGWILSLFATICVVYLPFLGSSFVFDDTNFFSGNMADHYAHALFQFDLRWLPYASLGWTYAIFSDELPHFFRLGNLLLHAVNVILLFFLLRQLAGAVIPEHEKTSSATWGAWFGALLFACHPIAVYAVGYVIQRSILMATSFALLTQWAYVRGLLSGQKRWLVLAMAAYFLAVFSKEHSVMLPAVLVTTTILLRKENRAPSHALWLTWAVLAAVALLVVLLTKGVFGVAYEPMAAHLFEQQGMAEGQQIGGVSTNVQNLHLLSMLTQAGLFFKYLGLWLLPNPAWMSVDMREPFVADYGMWQGWAGALGFILYGALGCKLLLRGRWLGLAGLALLYPWLMFLVEFSSVRVQEPFVLYRSYLWMPGMMLFFPWLLVKLPGRRTLLALGCVVLLLVPLSWNRLWVFADNYRLWNDAALLLPNERVAGADRIFYNRGNAALAAHKYDGAIADLQRVMAMSPQLAPVHYALGAAYFSSGRYRDAIAQFDAVIAIQPDDAQAYYGKGVSLKRLHEDEQAIQQMKKSCDLKNILACMIVAGAQGK